MKAARPWVSIAVVTFLILQPALHAGSRDAQWKRVEEAMSKGLPKTAIEELEPIIKQALAEKAWAEAVKAITRKIALEGVIQGGRAEGNIKRLEAEIAKAPKEIVPVLDTVLAHWYWQYFQQNRWRFMRRTATAAAPGKDFTTWDLPRLFAEIEKQFAKALAAEKELKAIPIAAYDELLVKGTLPDNYRPTLYDFIAQEALSFYTAGEQAAAKPEDAYELSADGPIFDEAAKFMAWQQTFATKDFPDTPIIKAIDLYGKLLWFHKGDRDQAAFLDVDLARLVYGKNVAVGENKTARLKAALKGFVDRNADHEVSALALYEWARLLQEERNLAEAHALATRGRNAHPQSVGGKLCANLIAEIEAKSASIATERVWNQPWPTIRVRYRNVTNVWFRAVAWDWDAFLADKDLPDYLSEAMLERALRAKPVLEWACPLPPTPDYKLRLAELPAPESLKAGFYVLLASHNPAFSKEHNQLAYTTFWVSRLALVLRPRAGQLEGFVLEGESGEPVAGAKVEVWHLRGQGGPRAVAPLTSDAEGFFALARQKDTPHLVRATHQGQQVSTLVESYRGSPEPAKPRKQTIFFTDRAIYRPGQSIQYKGICLSVDEHHDNYRTLAGQQVTVVFKDPNDKEIARNEHRANDYGSFAGSFVAPRDRLLGQMWLHVDRGPRGGASFSVEEYKRPKFQVTLDAPKTAAKLNEKVSVSGQAMSYTGAAVDGAQVKYRVVREVRLPWWCEHRFWRVGGRRWRPSQEIAHGATQTRTDGAFKIEFIAKADPGVPETDEPTFTFGVHADVTDSAGETRSADRSIRLGYTTLEATVSAADWQTYDQPVALSVTTTTLDNEPQKAEGTVKVHALKAPAKVHRPSLWEADYWQPHHPRLVGANYSAEDEEADEVTESVDLSKPDNWPLGQVVAEQGFTTDKEGRATLKFQLPTGFYRVMLETQDGFGKKVTARQPLRVLRPADAKCALRVPQVLAIQSDPVEPGGTFTAVWGTGYEQGRAFVEIEHRGKLIRRFWTPAGATQATIKEAVTEAMRGGFTLHVTQVRENRGYLESRDIDVPWSNKQLSLKWEHFTSKLQPAQQETWTAVVTGPKAEKAVAEMVATLYDASLDAFRPRHWESAFNFFRQDRSDAEAQFANMASWLNVFWSHWSVTRVPVELRYRAFPPELGMDLYGSRHFLLQRGSAVPAAAAPPPDAAGMDMRLLGRYGLVPRGLRTAFTPAPAKAPPALEKLSSAEAEGELAFYRGGGAPKAAQATADLAQVTARKNLNETAFFFPQLLSDTNGVVRLTFTMPEALTQWRFLGFAHDRDCRAGLLEGKTVTAKDLMVQPNPPRFLREGDTLEFTVKVSNQSESRQQGKVRLTLQDALTDQSADARLANRTPELAFDVPAKESRSFAWRLAVPDGLSVLAYKAVAAADKVSDGEEALLPVLARRILVTESLPLPIRGPATKKFDFSKLAASGKSSTLAHQSLTVQMVSQPAWYAVMALPYLMEFPYECTEQTFNRFYANALARFIANSDPKIRRVFDQWKATPALDSPLEKNQDLKSVVLEESPWLRQAQAESQARKNVGVLFDDNRLDYEMQRALQKVTEAQLPDGAWSWFPGGPGNDYITLYITTGFGRLRHLGADARIEPALRALARLDDWLDRRYRDILRDQTKEENHLSHTVALHLYGRSFFLKDKPVAANQKEALDYFLGQARRYWLELNCRQSQGHVALALLRFGDAGTAQAIMRSLKERSVTDEELGRFWRDTELSWWWYRAPIETQALMIEAFGEVANDAQAVEECKVWLLKQKQTQDWKTTKATADAVYALLLRGRDLLSATGLVEVALGGQTIKPEAVEAGTGFYEKRFAGPQVKPAQGQITVKKADQGVAWGSVHWQYLEDMTKVTAYEGTPLKLKKALFTKKNTSRGPVLEAVNSPLAVGDELVVRIELRADRDTEYVHLKDQRGSGTEPLNVLSGYRYQDGLAYYESTRDTASHFFIDYVPKGTYVFEYSTRVVHRGRYQTGIAAIQCMYAPEFNGHSESLRLEVK
jgi:uncharacterized protein YfaS (alpha-2-macroglobulin family)